MSFSETDSSGDGEEDLWSMLPSNEILQGVFVFFLAFYLFWQGLAGPNLDVWISHISTYIPWIGTAWKNVTSGPFLSAFKGILARTYIVPAYILHAPNVGLVSSLHWLSEYFEDFLEEQFVLSRTDPALETAGKKLKNDNPTIPGHARRVLANVSAFLARLKRNPYGAMFLSALAFTLWNLPLSEGAGAGASDPSRNAPNGPELMGNATNLGPELMGNATNLGPELMGNATNLGPELMGNATNLGPELMGNVGNLGPEVSGNVGNLGPNYEDLDLLGLKYWCLWPK